MSNWIYKGRSIEDSDIPEWAIGYVYEIRKRRVLGIGENAEGYEPCKIYIGKKMLTTTKTKKIGVRAQKKQLLEVGDKRRIKKVQKVVKESNWQKYWGSSEELKADVKKYGEDQFERRIIEWAFNKKNLSWLELKHQVMANVLEENTYNSCIAGHYWARDVINPYTKQIDK